MEISVEKLSDIIKKLEEGTKDCCIESAVFIGEVNGKPIRLSVLQKSEAEDVYGYEPSDNRHIYIP